MSITEIKRPGGQWWSPFRSEGDYGMGAVTNSTTTDDHWFDRFDHRTSADAEGQPPSKPQGLSDHLWMFSQLLPKSSGVVKEEVVRSQASGHGTAPSAAHRTWLFQTTSTAFAQMWRPVLGGILVLECVTCVLRCAVLRDCVGGFFMFMSILLGLYAWIEDMNITFIRYWGVMSCINGLLDAVILVDAAAQVHVPLFSERLPLAYNLASVLRVAGPLSQLFGVPLAWFLYKDHEEAKQASELEDKWSGTVRMDALVLGAFSGQGQRLGSAWDRT